MSAIEMFKELGFIYEYNNKYKIIIYHFEDWSISFDKKSKLIGFGNMYPYCELSIDVLQAINKQVEELGWNK